jgi:hypothetical protein
MDNDKFVLDTVGQAFFENELAYVATRTYDRKYPSLTARTVFPVASNFAPWAETVSFRSYAKQGAAKIMSDGAIDMPLGDVSGAQVDYPVKTIGAGFNYSDLELIRAQKTGTRLDVMRATAMREAIETSINSIAWDGNADHNLPGLFSDTDIGASNATTGTWVSTATAAQIVTDIQDWYAHYVDQCDGEETPNTIAMAPAPYARLAITPVNTYTTQSILQWLQAGGIPGVNTVYSCPECHSVSGLSSDDVAVLYNRSPDKLELKIPGELKIFSPQARGIGYHVPMYARVSGLHIYYPKSIYVLKNLEG